MISASLVAAASFTPRSLEVPDAWVGHLPFAAWVMREVAPGILVELGTHSGNSYFSFCQAAVEAGLAAKCHAVDTWRGDLHAGQYNDEIFAKVNAHNRRHYAGFSRLMRMAFDEAVTRFADESIDLLHIDGLHTYEALRHDFDTWLPKLAPGAVVLIHDTRVRERDFGVWKLWEELQARYPNNLEFAHSHGLGVFQLNNAPEEKILAWLRSAAPQKRQLTEYFAALGARQLDRYERAGLQSCVASLSQATAERERRIDELNRAVRERAREVTRLKQAVAERDAQSTALQATLTWRAGSSLRALSARYPRLSMSFHRTIQFAWWVITFQLAEKYRQRRALLAAKPHFSPPADDYALAVPLAYAPLLAASAPSLAVVCHLFFADMTGEFKTYLANIPFNFDLYITTDTEAKKRFVESAFAGWHRGHVEVRLAQNRGRDIAPKLITCRDIYDRHEFVLHIHSKHSPYGGHVAGWRKYLLETLLGSPDIVAGIFEVFRRQPGVGMITPQHMESVRPGIGWGLNFSNAKSFSRRLALKLDISRFMDFPSGSMFWARSAALKPLLDVGLSIEDFPVEGGQEDGTLAHVIERLYFYVCEAAGFDWIKIAQPGLLRNTKYRVVDAKAPADLTDFVETHRVHLLDKGRDASRLVRGERGSLPPHSPRMQLLRLAYENSTYRTLDFPDFVSAVTDLTDGRAGAIDFDENFYRSTYPDVDEAVKRGGFPCGYVHYCIAGKMEGRLWSDGELERRFGIRPAAGKGPFAPVHARPLLQPGPNLGRLPAAPRPFLLVLVSHLEEDLFYAGYGEFFRDFAQVFGLFSRVVIAVESCNFDSRIATRLLSTIEVMHAGDLPSLKQRPSIIVALNHRLLNRSIGMLNDASSIVYYCQDFEAGFFPYSAEYVLAERAVANSRNLIVSTGMLKRFLDTRGLVTDSANIFVTAPAIELFDVPSERSRKLFFYFRPEEFNPRNLPEILLDAVVSFCERNTGYEIYMTGSVATSYSFSRNGNAVFVMSKLPSADYIRLVSSCDVAVSLIYSAHPGVVAFQTAGSGIPTITNVFDNRSAAMLREISGNFIPYDPLREDLAALIETGLAMPKGRRSFNARLYGGRSENGLDLYFREILKLANNSAVH